MKKNIKFFLITLSLSAGIYSCSDDILNQKPQDAISDEFFFTKSSDLKNYMNGMYGELTRRVGDFRWQSLSDGSDNWLSNDPHVSLMQHAAVGEAPTSSDFWNGRYDYIRKVNYFLENMDKVPEDAQTRHYKGEAYYARAWAYFKLLMEFGGVPYIDKVLNIDSEELYSPRQSRDFIASKIMDDLDLAIDYLNWKGEGEAKAQRLNKQAALVFKTRVGLYEGSWEYYHSKKNSPFAANGNDGTSFLNQAVEAGEMLIAHEGNNLYVGPVGWEYFNLFNQMDYSDIPGAYFYFAYSRASEWNIAHNWLGTLSSGSYGNPPKSAIDSYLMKDGKPVEISSIFLDELSMASYSTGKDPRLSQTIYTPDRGVQTDYYYGGVGINILPVRYTGIRNQNQARHAGPGGIKVWKGTNFDVAEERDGGTDDLMIRYGEGLLNYAEAKAILGTISQTDLDKSVNLLRDRVDMPHMVLGEINSWNISYMQKDGYDPSAPNILNEIRRERRIELMFEGFRKDDIKRWALLEEVFNGWKPQGAPAAELADYWNDANGLIADGWNSDLVDGVSMTLGSDYDVDPSGKFINPYYLNPDFTEGGRGYYVNPDRDYLNGIPKDEINLYQQKGGVILEQNPGWF